MERILTNDRLIAYHRNKLDVEPFPSDKLNIAYKDNKQNQLLFHLNNFDLDMIKKTLQEIYNDLQCGDQVFKYSIKKPELLDRVFDFLYAHNVPTDNEKENEEVRSLASLCFKQYCLNLTVKEYLDDGRYIKCLIKIFNDPCEEVKINIYRGLIYFCQSRYGIDTLYKNEILETLIEKLNHESSYKIIDLILKITSEILNSETAPQISLNCGFIEKLKKYLNVASKNQETQNLKENVLLNLGYLSLCEEGKKDCVNDGELIINVLEAMKGDKSLNILINSTRFLNNVSILKRGKVEIYENGGLDLLLNLIETVTDEQLIINILQIIANVSEEPRARRKMLENLNRLEHMSQSTNNFIKSQSKITKEIILWKP